jgi:hypothetical protein
MTLDNAGKMRVKWFPPFDRYFGKISEIDLDRPILLREMLLKLRREEPAMGPYAKFQDGDRQAHGLMVWRKGQVLALDDTLHQDDELEVIIMVAGG